MMIRHSACIVFLAALFQLLTLSSASAGGSIPGKDSRQFDSLARYYRDFSVQFEKAGRYTEALLFFKLYQEATDSLKNQERKTDFILLEKKYRNETRENLVALLSKEKMLKEAGVNHLRISIYLTVVVIIIILASVFVFLNRARIRAGREELAIRQNLLLSQMNPHFLFNTLTNIQSLIMQQDRELSTRYLDMFALLTWRIRKHSEAELVPLEDEISLLRDYIELQKLRYRDQFETDFTSPDPGIASVSLIPPMMLQPAVENAIEHGLKYKQEKGLLIIRVERGANKEIVVKIEDNGIGREKAAELVRQHPGHHQGVATKITLDRIERFNRRKKRKIKFEISDKRSLAGEPEGTIAKFVFPQMKMI